MPTPEARRKSRIKGGDMANVNHVSETIFRHKLQDVEEAFHHGLKLYRFELMLGSVGIGVTTLVVLAAVAWITSTGASRETGLGAAAVVGVVGFLVIIWLRGRVRAWTRELVKQTNGDRAAAYQVYIQAQDKL